MLQNLQQQVACIVRGDLHDASRERQIAQEFMARMENKMRDLSANMAKVMKSLNEMEVGFSNLAQRNVELQNQVQVVHVEIAKVKGSLFDFLQQDHQKWEDSNRKWARTETILQERGKGDGSQVPPSPFMCKCPFLHSLPTPPLPLLLLPPCLLLPTQDPGPHGPRGASRRRGPPARRRTRTDRRTTVCLQVPLNVSIHSHLM